MSDFDEVKIKIEKLLKLSPKRLIVIVIAILAVILTLTTLYTVNPEEVGIIQRFGKYVSTTEPGLHFKLPFGIDNLTKVRVKHVFKEEFGFRTITSGVKSTYSTQGYDHESLMLTGDLNIADVEWKLIPDISIKNIHEPNWFTA